MHTTNIVSHHTSRAAQSPWPHLQIPPQLPPLTTHEHLGAVPAQLALSLSRSLYSPTHMDAAHPYALPHDEVCHPLRSLCACPSVHTARGAGMGRVSLCARGSAQLSAPRSSTHSQSLRLHSHVSALKSARHTRATHPQQHYTAAVCRLCTSSPLVPPQCTGLSVCAASPDWPFDWPMPGSAGSLLVRLVLMGASRCGRRIGWGPPPRPEPPNG